MAVSGLIYRNNLVGTGRAMSVLFGISGVGNKRSHLVGPPFPSVQGLFFSYGSLSFLKSLNWKFVNWWVWLESHICLRVAEITSGRSFEPKNPTERRLGYVVLESEMISRRNLGP